MSKQNRTAVDFYVDKDGRVRDHWPWGMDAVRAAKADAAKLRDNCAALAKLPEGTSSEIIAAQGRGAVNGFADRQTVAVGTNKSEVVAVRYPKGKPVKGQDVFDRMCRHGKRRSSEPPLTPQQIGAGRDYAVLTEKCAALGIKCSSAFNASTSGSREIDFMDAVLRDMRRLDMFKDAIGDGIAKAPRYKAKAMEGSVIVGEVDLIKIGKKLITVRALVDQVCLGDKELSNVLRSHGWSAFTGNLEILQRSLASALTRMQGIGAG